MDSNDSSSASVESAQEVERFERGERHLATFLNSSLSALGGLWVGVVPLAWISTGGPLGGFTGFVASSGLLFVALQAFFGRHPWISHNAKLRSFGLEIRRRSDGAKRYWVIAPERMPQRERLIFEEQLKQERSIRIAKSLESRRRQDDAKSQGKP